MSRGWIEKRREEIEALRRTGGIKRRTLERLARKIGRVRHSRGKEPNWVSTVLPDARPLSIPAHNTLNRYTAQNILDALESDLDAIEEANADE